MKKLISLPQKIVLGLIRIYQKTLSFDHGIFSVFYPFGYCRFYPSCSEYAHRVIERRGLLKGGIMAFWRILRCNPFSKGGYDPVKKGCCKWAQ